MAGRIRGEPLLSNKQGSNGCLLRVQEPLCARKLNIPDRQNGRWQIAVALPRAIDWTTADYNCYQQPQHISDSIFFLKACQIEGIRIPIKKTFLFVCNYI